jgi:hypothetical protein
MSLAKKDANEATSPTVSPTAPNTAALAASSSGRRSRDQRGTDHPRGVIIGHH